MNWNKGIRLFNLTVYVRFCIQDFVLQLLILVLNGPSSKASQITQMAQNQWQTIGDVLPVLWQPLLFTICSECLAFWKAGAIMEHRSIQIQSRQVCQKIIIKITFTRCRHEKITTEFSSVYTEQLKFVDRLEQKKITRKSVKVTVLI